MLIYKKLSTWSKTMAVVDITSATFDETLTGNDLVLIDFWADWCGPCKSFAPVYEKVSEAYPDVVFAKVDTEAEQELAAHFQIRSIPTIMVVRQQVILMAQPGALREPDLKDVIEKALALNMDEVRASIEAEKLVSGDSEQV
jgi:thioredoxin 1